MGQEKESNISNFIYPSLLVAGCSLKRIQHNTDLGESIYSIVNDKSNNETRLNTLTDFMWDKAFLITPYSAQREIKEQLGFPINDESAIDWRDDIYPSGFPERR
ncbi:hypothetical protein [Cytobacillus firmus]|uniref:hypothetical protein n=1 Tax=Cytobacillus firmus TaxID=1399 RepID=UPI002162D427|nr:hypothetical protein [Cytobacillus firmus]MCS0670199.1 hypothetical protein [Cytobacillus firmus]